MRGGAWGLAWAIAVAPLAFGHDTVGAADAPCTVNVARYKLREVECVVPPEKDLRRWRFQAHFSGGHDDTEASMTLTLDGRALTCDPGSKTSLMGEDGEVSLECRFTADALATRPRKLVATVKFHHAEYTGADLSAL